MTLRELAALVRRRFEHAGLSEAELEAGVLVRTAAGVERAAYFAGALATPAVIQEVDRLTGRRLAREPLAYVTGHREFFGLRFGVNAAVLIPRPESELLVERTLELTRAMPGATVVDVGTGSGCLAIAIATHRADNGLTLASDLSAPAIAVARTNATVHGAAVQFMRMSLASALRDIDVVVANLPYIPGGEVDALEPELRDWEPRMALDGGEDGLELIRQLIDDCACRLHPTAVLLEVAYGEAGPVAAYSRSRGYAATLHRDLAGIDRVVELR